MKNKLLDQGCYYLGALFVLSLYTKENINSIFFVVFILSTLFIIIKNKNRAQGILNSKYFSILVISYFLLGFLGFFLDSNSKFNYLVRLLPFFLFPLVYHYFFFFKKRIVFFIKLFVVGNIIFLIILDFSAILDVIMNQSLFVIQGEREYYRFLYTRYTDGGNFEHIYLSLYSFFSGILLFQFQFTSKKYRIVLGIYLLVHLFMLGSRAIIISIIFGGLLYLLIVAIKDKRYIKYLLSFSLIIFLLFSTTFLFKDTLFFNRYAQVFEWYNKSDLILERNYSVNNRLKVYIIGVEACFKSGGGINGTGVAERKIKETYDLNFTDRFPFKTNTYNTHNQYINNFIDWGYLGVIVLLCLLFLIIKNCFKENLLWVGFFWICFSILLLMECVLYRQRGIFLFVIFLAIFAQTSIINNNTIFKNEE